MQGDEETNPSTTGLPAVRARVETIEVGGKPSPPGLYGIGTVESISWDRVFKTWRVNVRFDGRTGGWYGLPILGTMTFPWMAHVIGSDERAFSDMKPDEIWELYRQRRRDNLSHRDDRGDR
jgi:hypothetical protein